MQLPVYNLAGEVVRQIDVNDAVFGAPMNESLVHQVIVSLRANQRQGTASTKTRGDCPRQHQEALPAEGDRLRPRRLEEIAAAPRRGRHFRPAPA